MTTEGYQALRNGAAVVDLPRGAILVRGRDRVRWLHNLCTSDVKKLAPGAGCYTFLLNPQGRIQADLNLFHLTDRFLIDTEAGLAEKVLAHLRRYIVADQVELEDVTASRAAIGVEGPEAAAVLANAGIPVAAGAYASVEWRGAAVATVTATGQPGYRLFVPAASRDEFLGLLAPLAAATAEDVRVVRIENGRPLYGEDMDGTSLPQETQQMHGVSFGKGCYLGQEIVERIRARGHVNRTLVRVEIDGAAPPPSGTKLMAGGEEAGEITSAVYSPAAGKTVALAYVRAPHNTAGAALCVDSTAARVC